MAGPCVGLGVVLGTAVAAICVGLGNKGGQFRRTAYGGVCIVA